MGGNQPLARISLGVGVGQDGLRGRQPAELGGTEASFSGWNFAAHVWVNPAGWVVPSAGLLQDRSLPRKFCFSLTGPDRAKTGH